MQGAIMLDHRVVSVNGELLGESDQRKGAELMQALFEIRGIKCRVESRNQREPLSPYAQLRVELLESRN